MTYTHTLENLKIIISNMKGVLSFSRNISWKIDSFISTQIFNSTHSFILNEFHSKMAVAFGYLRKR